jgi:hypothetical protein
MAKVDVTVSHTNLDGAIDSCAWSPRKREGLDIDASLYCYADNEIHLTWP